MRHFLSIFTLFAVKFCVFFGPGEIAAATQVLPEELFPELSQLLSVALEQSLNVNVGRLKVDEAEGNLDTAEGRRRTHVNTYGRATVRSQNRDDIDGASTQGLVIANLQVTRPLFHWGSLEAAEEMGELRRDSAISSLLSIKGNLLINVRNLYLQLALSRQSGRLHEKNLELGQKLISNQERLLELGQSTPQQLLETRLLLQQFEENLLSTEKHISNLEDRLGAATGTKVLPGVLGNTSFPPVLPLEEIETERIQLVLNNALPPAPSILHWEKNLEIEKLNWKVLRQRTKPKIDLVLGIFQDQVDTVSTDEFVNRFNYFAGFQVNWNIFDGFETKGMLSSSRSRQRMYELQLEQAEMALAQEGRQFLREILFLERQMATREKKLSLLNQQLALKERQVDEGLIPANEYLRETINFENANIELMRTKVNYLLGISNLYIVMGEDPLLNHGPQSAEVPANP